MTKYYSKGQIAEFSIVTVLAFLCSKFANLKLFDAIIREPDTDIVEDNFTSALSLALYGSVVIGILLGIASSLGIHLNLLFIGKPGYEALLILLLIQIVTSSIIPVVSSGLLKKEELTLLTRGRIVKSIVQVVILVFYITQEGPNGLIIALVLSGLVQVLYYSIGSRELSFQLVSPRQIITTISHNKDILYYTLPTSLLLSLRENAIVQIIQISFGEGALAAFTIADRILRLPSVVLGSAATETLYKYGSDTFYTLSKATFLKQLKRGVIRFALLLLMLAIICTVLAYPVLSFLFEDKWALTSELLWYYSLWIVPFSLVAMMRNIPVMLRQQSTYVILEILLFLITIVGLWIVSQQASFAEAMFFKYFAEAIVMIVIVLSIFNLVNTAAREEAG